MESSTSIAKVKSIFKYDSQISSRPYPFHPIHPLTVQGDTGMSSLGGLLYIYFHAIFFLIHAKVQSRVRLGMCFGPKIRCR